MSFADYPHGITSFGVPVFGGDFISGGNRYFIDPTNTDSAANSDGSIKQPLTNLVNAYNKTTTGKNDVIHYIAGTTGVSNLSSTLTWAKSYTHLMGQCAPVGIANRARIFQTSTATGVSPLLDVTGSGNVFSNLYLFHGVNDATSLINTRVTGSRNYFYNCHFAGVGNATQSAAGACDLFITGSENVFKNCFIGLDTITRDANPNNIVFDTAASRNRFEDCIIYAYISAAGYASVKVTDATAIDRFTIFKNCLFMTKSDNKATTQTSVFSIPAISQGAIVLQNSYAFSDGGAVDWDSNNRGIIWNNSVAAAASAAGGIMTAQ